MKTRIIKLIYPYKPNSNLIKLSISGPPISKKCVTIYDTVDFFLHNIFLKSKFNTFIKSVKNRILLNKITNLHNDVGIKDITQIKSMLNQIISGKDIFNTNKLPNIKLVKSKDNHWILFDGHHTMLAYMFTGRTYLHEIPHLIIEDEERGYASDKEICVFFGEHASKIKGNNWKEYVINWQAEKGKQLCKRIQKNMGEVYGALYEKFPNIKYQEK
jgi:hypothetical protein